MANANNKPDGKPVDEGKTQPQTGANKPPAGGKGNSAPPPANGEKPATGASDAALAEAKAKEKAKAAKEKAATKKKAALAKKKREAFLQEPFEHLHGNFPIGALKSGFAARRKAWAPDYELTLSHKGTRGKRVSAFYQSGTRSGQIEWKPKTIDDLVADDWLVIMTKGQAIDAGLLEVKPE